MMKMITPNTNISAGSVKTAFIKDKAVTGDKIATTGATDAQVLSYDLATNTVVWADNLTDLSGLTTSDLSEGSNLYYTDDRVLNWFSTIGVPIINVTPIDYVGTFTGDLTGDVHSYNVDVQPATPIIPGGWSAYGGYQYIDDTPLVVGADGALTFAIVARVAGSNAAFLDTRTVIRDYDFSSGTPNDDLTIFNTTFIDTPGGGSRRTSANYTRLREIAVLGTDGTDCEYDAYKSHLEFIIYDKASGSNEVSHNVFTATSDGSRFHKSLRIFDKPLDSGDIDLSGVILEYTGAQKGAPDSMLKLYEDSSNTTTDMVRFRNDSGTYKTEFKTTINLDNRSGDPSTSIAGDMYFNTSTAEFRGYDGTDWDSLGGTDFGDDLIHFDNGTVATGDQFVVGNTIPANGTDKKSLGFSSYYATGGDFAGNEVTTIAKATLTSTGGYSSSGGIKIMTVATEFSTPTKWSNINLTDTAQQVNGMTGMHPTNGKPIYYYNGWKYFNNDGTAS